MCQRKPLCVLLLMAILLPHVAIAFIVHVSVGPGNVFSPQFPVVSVGDTVRWTLIGGAHNVNSDTGLFRSGDVSSSWPAPFDIVLDSPGIFGYHCEAHGAPVTGMFGTITVREGIGSNRGILQFSTS